MRSYAEEGFRWSASTAVVDTGNEIDPRGRPVELGTAA
jgi:hypothetical protein